MSCLRTSAARRGVTCVPSGARAWTAPRWKISPSIGAPLEHAALGRLELVEAGGEQRLQGRRDADLAVGRVGHREHLRDEERIAAGSAERSVPAGRRRAAQDQLVDVLGSQRLDPEGDRPGRTALAEFGTRHAEQEDRRAGGEECDVLDEVEEVSRPTGCRRRRPPPVAGRCSSSLRTAQAISSARRWRFALAEERANRAAAAASSGGRTSSCFTTSTTGQYVIPSP